MASKKGKPDKAAKPSAKKKASKKAVPVVDDVEEDEEHIDPDDAEAEPDDVDPEELDEDLEDGEFAEGDDEFESDDEDFSGDDEEEGDEAPIARRPTDEEDDDDLTTPDDVEADLDTILKDRLVAAEDVPEEDDEEQEVDERSPDGDALQPRRADEEMCTSCFLLVRRAAPNCPVGDDGCPIFAR